MELLIKESRSNSSIKSWSYRVIVRSLTTTLDDYPHTGSTYYNGLSLNERIPAAAISTNGAELLVYVIIES